jgi:hypothetical protein
MFYGPIVTWRHILLGGVVDAHLGAISIEVGMVGAHCVGGIRRVVGGRVALPGRYCGGR